MHLGDNMLGKNERKFGGRLDKNEELEDGPDDARQASTKLHTQVTIWLGQKLRRLLGAIWAM